MTPSHVPEHAHALALLAAGDPDGACSLLRATARDAVDPELINDLAVITAQAGEVQAGADLLRGLLALHPEHAPAAENLAALHPPPAPAPEDLGATETARHERRARLLQTIAEGVGTHLADNIDYLFEPWGRELPDPAAAGARIAAQLDVLDRCDVLWRSLGDEDSQELLLRFLAYRALGPAHVRLQLDPGEYRRAVIGLSAVALARATAVALPRMPMEWQMHHYDLRGHGLPIQVVGPPLPLASTMLFSQYAYRDAAVSARPRHGDVALDVGGCWGETALWLAHAVGLGGRVHTFEPAPGNRRLLEANLSLNPELAARITVWGDALAGRSGEAAWIPDVIGAGASLASADSGSGGETPMVELRTRSIDDFVSERAIDRVDFLKVDVEGADLGVLEGAAATIRRDRPRLALACYHKPDDLAVLPRFLHSLGVGYRWYLQCSTMTDVDTVAFAVPVA